MFKTLALLALLVPVMAQAEIKTKSDAGKCDRALGLQFVKGSDSEIERSSLFYGLRPLWIGFNYKHQWDQLEKSLYGLKDASEIKNGVVSAEVKALLTFQEFLQKSAGIDFEQALDPIHIRYSTKATIQITLRNNMTDDRWEVDVKFEGSEDAIKDVQADYLELVARDRAFEWIKSPTTSPVANHVVLKITPSGSGLGGNREALDNLTSAYFRFIRASGNRIYGRGISRGF